MKIWNREQNVLLTGWKISLPILIDVKVNKIKNLLRIFRFKVNSKQMLKNRPTWQTEFFFKEIIKVH